MFKNRYLALVTTTILSVGLLANATEAHDSTNHELSKNQASEKQIEANLAKVRAAYDAIETNDVDEFMKAFDEPRVVVPEVLPYGGIHDGPEAAMRAMRNITGAWDDRLLEVEALLASDDMVVAVATFIGTGKATGMRISFPFHAVWRFRDGKLVELEPVYGDTALVIEALQGYQPVD